jgi:hypothetical protein
VSTHAANHHEVRLVQLCFDFYMIEAKPETLLGDRAYDSDPLDDQLREDGIEMVAPHRSNRRKRATQDGRRLRRYARRWLVGVSSEGHTVMSVKVRPELKDSGFEAREAPWRERMMRSCGISNLTNYQMGSSICPGSSMTTKSVE